MRRHRSGVDGVGRVKEGLLAGGRTRIYTGASAWRSRGVQGLVIWPGKSPRRTVFQFGPQNWSGGPVRLGSPGGFPGLGLKTWRGVRCGRTAWRVSWFGPQNQEVAPGAVGRPGRFLGLGLKTKVGGLARLSGPRTCRGTCRSWFRWFGLKTIIDEGFPGFDSKPGAAPGLTRRPGGHVAHTRWTRGGEELMPITRGRPMGEKGKMDENAPAWVV
jgi:hypothetical protein